MSGPAVTPEEAAESLVEWAGNIDISKTGEYWAPRGPGTFCGHCSMPMSD